MNDSCKCGCGKMPIPVSNPNPSDIRTITLFWPPRTEPLPPCNVLDKSIVPCGALIVSISGETLYQTNITPSNETVYETTLQDVENFDFGTYEFSFFLENIGNQPIVVSDIGILGVIGSSIFNPPIIPIDNEIQYQLIPNIPSLIPTIAPCGRYPIKIRFNTPNPVREIISFNLYVFTQNGCCNLDTYYNTGVVDCTITEHNFFFELNITEP